MENWHDDRNKIIGLGEHSFRKSYYPELQNKIEELEISRSNLESILSSMSDAVIIHDFSGNIFYLNKRALELYNINEQEITNYSIVDILSKSINIADLPIIWKEVELHKTKTLDWIALQIGTNKEFPVQVSINQINWHGASALVAVVRDFTEHKRAEEALRVSEERLRDIANKVPGIVYQFFTKDNGEWGFYFVSERSEEIFGVKAEPLESYFNRFFDCVVEEDKERFITSIKEAASNVSSWEFEGKLITPATKEEKYVRGISVPKRQKDEIVFNGILLDITERKKVEETLLTERGLFVGGPSVVFKWKAKEGWPVEYVSPNVKDQFGYSQEDLTSGKVSYATIVHPDDIERVATEVSAYSEQDVASFEQIYRIARADGSYRWIDDFTTVIRGYDGTITSYLGYILDITERKQAEEEIRKLNQELEQRVVQRTAQLEVTNKELEAFAHSVSHDLQTPLRSIDGFSQALLEDYQNKIDTQGKDYLHRIRLATQRMAQLIDDMLNLSRVSLSEMNIQQVNLSLIAQEIADNLHLRKPERHVKIIIQEGIKVQGDDRLLRIVLENLFENAWKFTSKHTSACIEFGVQQKNNTQEYFVRDDGAGFDMNYAQRLFGAFQRLHTTIEFPGTGIGLATVQRVIHRHSGIVWAEGKIEKGVTIYFTIP